MKKFTLLFLASFVTLIVLVGCSSNSIKSSDKAISIGKQAIKVIDDYLDGNMDSKTAHDELDKLHSKLDYISELSSSNKNKNSDMIIRIDILSASTAIFLDGSKSTPAKYDAVKDVRNKLAKELGEKMR